MDHPNIHTIWLKLKLKNQKRYKRQSDVSLQTKNFKKYLFKIKGENGPP